MQYYKSTKQDDAAHWARIRDRVVHRGDCATPFHKVQHRERGNIPSIFSAQDVFVWEDGHLVIKNPSKPYRPAY